MLSAHIGVEEYKVVLYFRFLSVAVVVVVVVVKPRCVMWPRHTEGLSSEETVTANGGDERPQQKRFVGKHRPKRLEEHPYENP